MNSSNIIKYIFITVTLTIIIIGLITIVYNEITKPETFKLQERTKYEIYKLLNNNIIKETFNIFEPKTRNEFNTILNKYDNDYGNTNNMQLYKSINDENVIDYLENKYSSLVNKNIAMETYMERKNKQLEQELNSKLDDLDLIDIGIKSKIYFSSKKNIDTI
jgi:hypothetical protein